MVIRNFINEFVLFFTAIKNGLVYIFTVMPFDLFELLKIKPADQEKVDISEAVNNGSYAGDMLLSKEQNKDLIDVVSDKMRDLYYKIPYIKEKQQKFEASLKPLVLDPNGADGVKSAEKQTYEYVARTKEGRIVKDHFSAYSRVDVYSYLTDEGMIVYSIETSKQTNFLHAQSSIFKTKMTNKDLIFWLTQLSTYIKAGIPLTDGVRVLAQQDKKRKYKSLYKSIIY